MTRGCNQASQATAEASANTFAPWIKSISCLDQNLMKDEISQPTPQISTSRRLSLQTAFSSRICLARQKIRRFGAKQGTDLIRSALES